LCLVSQRDAGQASVLETVRARCSLRRIREDGSFFKHFSESVWIDERRSMTHITHVDHL
jgi:hypothetical protein